MSDSVIRLKIDSKEYDANIKRAGQALTDYFNKVRAGGGTLEHLDEGVLEAVQAMGELGTKADSVKGQLRELTQATADMTLAYRNLTDEERNSPIGEAMSESIQRMTERAGQARDAMADVQASINAAASDTRIFDQVSGGIGLMTSSFQTAQGAAKLLGIELGDNVEVIARLQAAMAVTNGLTQIQTVLQRQSAVMQGVLSVQTRAAAAAQVLLARNTAIATTAGAAFNVIAKANPIGLLVTGITVAVGAFALLSKAFGGAKDKAEELAKAEEEAKKKQEEYQQSLVDTGNSIESNLYAKFISLRAEWSRLEDTASKTTWIKENANAFRELGATITSIKDAEDMFVNNSQVMVDAIMLRARAAVLQKKMEKALEQGISNTPSGSGNAPGGKYKIGYSIAETYAEEQAAVNAELASLMKRFRKVSGGVGGRSGGKGGTNNKAEEVQWAVGTSGFNEENIQAWTNRMKDELSKADFGTAIYESLKNNIAQMDAVVQLVEEAMKRGFNPQDLGLDNIFEQVFNREAVDPSQFQGVVDTLNWVIKEGLDPLVFDVDTSGLKSVKIPSSDKKDKEDKDKKEVNLSQEMSKIVGGVSGMLSGIESLGVELPQGLKDVMGGIQGVMNILTAITTIVSAIQAIATADVILPFPFARGGVVRAAVGYEVPGNHFSGDMVPALLNSGETVLNRAQSGILAAALEGAGTGNMSFELKASGENLIAVIDRTGKRKGMGELCWWKN